MNTRLNLPIVAVALSLASCVYTPPRPINRGTGVNLDRPASGDRSARETRYLEQEVTQPSEMQTTVVEETTVTTTTDPAAIQPPSGATPPPPDAPPTPSTADKPKDSVPPPAAPAASELPYGVPVPGKKGFVYSPYDKSAGFVDVRDIGPSTKVRCPYTGKIFRVP